MKKILFVVLVVLLFSVGLCGCGPNQKYVTVEFPNIQQQVGYRITFSSQSSEYDEDAGKGSFLVGEEFMFVIEADSSYTLKDMVVKSNGEEVESYETDIYEYKETRRFNLSTLTEPKKITVEGVKEKELTLKMARAKYRENENDTEGKYDTDYIDSHFILEFDGTNFNSLNSAINYINSKQLKFNFGDTFEIWIGTFFANCYYNYSYSLIAFSSEFDGILYKEGEDLNSLDNIISINEPKRKELYEFEERNNMYKFVIEVKEDLVLCLDTKALKPMVFSVEDKGYSVFRVNVIEDPDFGYAVVYGKPWSFTVSKLLTEFPLFIDEEFYRDMKVYVNGYLILPSTDGKYHIGAQYPPAAYHEDRTNNEKYIITFSGMDLDNLYDPSDYRDLYSLYSFRFEQTAGIEDINFIAPADVGYFIPYFYDNESGACYYSLASAWLSVQISFKVLDGYYGVDLGAKINGILISDYDSFELTYDEDEGRYLITLPRTELLNLTEQNLFIELLGIGH